MVGGFFPHGLQPLIDLEAAAKVLGVTYSAAARLAREGVLPGVVLVGRLVRVRPEVLAAFIEKGGARHRSEGERTA